MTFEFEFDMLTKDGCLIAERIPFRGNLTGHRQPAEPDVGSFQPFWEDIDVENVEIEVTMRNRDKPHRGFSGGNTVWQTLPVDMNPYFQRWLDLPSTQELLMEQLEEDRRGEEPEPEREHWERDEYERKYI